MADILRLRCARGIGFDRLYPLSVHWIVLPDASRSTSVEPVTSVSAAASYGSSSARCVGRTADSVGPTASRCVLPHKPDEFTGEKTVSGSRSNWRSVTSVAAWQNGCRCGGICHNTVQHSGSLAVFVYLFLAVRSSKCQSDSNSFSWCSSRAP
jgi:hypothetical protein